MGRRIVAARTWRPGGKRSSAPRRRTANSHTGLQRLCCHRRRGAAENKSQPPERGSRAAVPRGARSEVQRRDAEQRIVIQVCSAFVAIGGEALPKINRSHQKEARGQQFPGARDLKFSAATPNSE